MLSHRESTDPGFLYHDKDLFHKEELDPANRDNLMETEQL